MICIIFLSIATPDVICMNGGQRFACPPYTISDELPGRNFSDGKNCGQNFKTEYRHPQQPSKRQAPAYLVSDPHHLSVLVEQQLVEA